MQINSIAPSLAALAGHAGRLLIPDLISLTSLSPQAQALRDHCDAQDDRRRRDDRDAQHGVAAVDAATQPKPADLAAEAAEEAATAERATREQVQSTTQQRLSQQRDAFQRTLANAASRQNNAAARLNTESAPPTADAASPEKTSTTHAAPPPAHAAKALPPNTVPLPGGATPADAAVSNHPRTTSGIADPRLPSVAATAPGFVSASPPPVSARVANTTQPDAHGAAPMNVAALTTASREVQPVQAALTATPSQPAAQRTASNASPVPTPVRDTGKTDANFERILRVLRAQLSHNRSHTTLQLDPPELGQIRMHLDLRHELLTLRVEPQTDLAYRLLSEQVDSLRDGLHASGVQLEQIEIRPPEAGAATDSFDLPTHAGGGQAGGGAEAETESPQQSGTESPATGPPEHTARDADSEPVAEPRVNIWA